jgi:hypothetical protein
MLCRPYRKPWVNNLAAISCSCVVGLVVLNSAPSFFISVGFSPIGTPLERVEGQVAVTLFLKHAKL